MPTSSPTSPDALSANRSFDPFQRKIGSLRENKKLFQILQQFEKASHETHSSFESSLHSAQFPKFPESAPPSLTYSNNNIKNELPKSNVSTPIRHVRSYSETDACSKPHLRPYKWSKHVLERTNSVDKTDIFTLRKKPDLEPPKDNYNRLKLLSVKAPSFQSFSPITHKSLELVNKDSSIQTLNVNRIYKNSKTTMKINATSDAPPPIPRRGLSMPISSILQIKETPVKRLSPPSVLKSPSSPKSFIKQDSVKKAVQMYEGLSEKGVKTSKNYKKSGNYPKIVLRKDSTNMLSNSIKGTVTRKSSRKNSFRSSKNATSSKDDSKRKSGSFETKQNEVNKYQHSKEDSGIGFSDTEDSRRDSGSIYQTLENVSILKDEGDTYDRLNRIHDMVHRIHKGQISSCAACKAIPTTAFHLRQTNTPSLLQVKCNELSPHHHPPCICFSCQHSVISCSQNSTPLSKSEVSLENLKLTDEQDNLYYNVCCLTGPSCWRQSRRRPVCEQNGKLCVVNCDMEKKNVHCEFYEKLSECHTTSRKVTSLQNQQTSKNGFVDSCDSDEGWVDVTDSEEEKLLSYTKRSPNDAEKSPMIKVEDENEYSLCGNQKSEELALYSKVGSNDMSRSASSEHLYETIPDIQYDSDNCDTEKIESVIPSTGDNDPDSGEWSTESSSSPTPGETSRHFPIEQKSSNTSETSMSRFTVGSDVITIQKKTFIKSVLGKNKVSPKKRRMSNFFVPWLVSNHEYGASRSPKATLKKQTSRSAKNENSLTSSRSLSKNKRSQSIPSCSTTTSLSCAKAVFSSTDILDRCKTDMNELEQTEKHVDNLGLSSDSIQSLSPRGSVASSSYIRPDQLQITPFLKSKSSSSVEEAVDVSVEKIFKRSTSGDSMHSYFVFRPIKEEEVPLYQFYERNIKERVSHCRSPPSLSPVMWPLTVDGLSDCSQKNSFFKPQLSVVEQLSPDAKDIKMLWCELPEVKESGILERISAQELKLQEAAFEFIQSQASYIRSLKVLYEHFIQAPEFSDIHSSCCVLSKHEHDVLFSDIIRVKEVSENVMAELTTRWSDGILIPDICDIIYKHAILPSFSIYVKYCSNRVYQERTLKELKETRLCFLEILRKLESNPVCQGLSLESFLFLPMQHIARLPLLLDSIFRWLSSDSPSFNTCKLALESVHKTFMQCNEGARKMERLEEMFILNKQLEFKECKVIPLISASRWLLKRGELTKLEFDKKTFGRTSRCVRIPIYVFLFNDLILITKRKSEDNYIVLDYCSRDKVQAIATTPKDLQYLTMCQPDLVPANCRYLIYLTLFSNHQGSSVDMILNCTLLSEQTRWIEAIHPVSAKKTNEVWEYDYPQVQCVRSYIAQQPDELSLQDSDVITISRKMNDGWYEGRRLRDGSQGWFPASYTMDIPCSRARASNLRQCYRLLMLSQKHESKTH